MFVLLSKMWKRIDSIKWEHRTLVPFNGSTYQDAGVRCQPCRRPPWCWTGTSRWCRATWPTSPRTSHPTGPPAPPHSPLGEETWTEKWVPSAKWHFQQVFCPNYYPNFIVGYIKDDLGNEHKANFYCSGTYKGKKWVKWGLVRTKMKLNEEKGPTNPKMNVISP